MALARSLTACATAVAWSSPSSWSGVIQTIWMGMPCFSPSSLAAVSAPLRADTKTGLVVLFAIIAILRPGPRAGSEAAGGAAGCSPPQAPNQLVISITMSAVVTLLFIGGLLSPRF